jgi:hypothetical protein
MTSITPQRYDEVMRLQPDSFDGYVVRSVKSYLFEPVPLLEKSLGDKVFPLVRALISCSKKGLLFPFDWTWHVSFLHWVGEVAGPETTQRNEIRVESMLACAKAWAVDDYINRNQSHCVIVDVFSKLAVGAVRPRNGSEQVKSSQLSIPSGIPFPIDGNPKGFIYGASNDGVVNHWESM